MAPVHPFEILRKWHSAALRFDRGICGVAYGALLLGPGTTVSQQAMVLLAESGSTAVWVGEHGVRYYAHGRTLTNSVAETRGREGARVRRLYRAHARRTGVEWERRDYDPTNFDGGTPVNQALSAANTSLYGVVHAGDGQPADGQARVGGRVCPVELQPRIAGGVRVLPVPRPLRSWPGGQPGAIFAAARRALAHRSPLETEPEVGRARLPQKVVDRPPRAIPGKLWDALLR